MKWSDADDALLVATMTTQKADGYWGDNVGEKCERLSSGRLSIGSGHVS